MWTFGQFLPLVICHLVPCDDLNWLNYIRLLDIMDILFAPKVHIDDCSYLETLISDHHHSLKMLYPGRYHTETTLHDSLTQVNVRVST